MSKIYNRFAAHSQEKKEKIDIILRKYTNEDRLICINILESNVPRYFSTQDREDFRAFLETSPEIYSVLQDQTGMIIGCGGISTREQGREGILTWGMIHATRQQQGWGRYLTLARFSQLSQISSIETITLHTSQETVGFYEKLGFRTTAFTPDYYEVGLHRYDMVLDLDEQFRQRISDKLTKSREDLNTHVLPD